MRRIVLLLVGLLVGCKGAEGAVGPAGPQGTPGVTGPQGPAGPGNRITFTGQLGVGGATFVDLPAAAGTIASPPLYACYLLFSVAGNPTWFQTGDPAAGTSATCALAVPVSGTTLRVAIAGGTGGQAYAVVVVY